MRISTVVDMNGDAYIADHQGNVGYSSELPCPDGLLRAPLPGSGRRILTTEAQ